MQPARMSATPYLHAALRALAGNLFLESGVRSRDSGAERLAVELSCLLVCKYPKKSRPHVSAGKRVPCLLCLLLRAKGMDCVQKDEENSLKRFRHAPL